eukprot:4343318-Pyramimonas_sp.AAC.1
MGIKLQDLPDQDGNTYKGIMVPNPNRPYLEHDVTNQWYAKLATHKMQPSQQLFEAQSSGTYSYVKKARRNGKLGHLRYDVRQRTSALSFILAP